MRISSRRGDTPVQANPVPRGLLTRRQGGSRRSRTVPLVRVPRTLPRILSPDEADRLVGALRTHRDRAMVLAMLLAGLRRCEVLGLRFADVQVADRRLAVTEGKGGHHRIVPVANRFFDALGACLHDERPAASTDRVFVVLKGPRRGLPLSAEGLDEILAATPAYLWDASPFISLARGPDLRIASCRLSSTTVSIRGLRAS
jgi:integrase/recombinase XerD